MEESKAKCFSGQLRGKRPAALLKITPEQGVLHRTQNENPTEAPGKHVLREAADEAAPLR